jgi:hypothetical protein
MNLCKYFQTRALTRKEPYLSTFVPFLYSCLSMGRLRVKCHRHLPRKICLSCGKHYELRRGIAIHMAKNAICRTWFTRTIARAIAGGDDHPTGSDTDKQPSDDGQVPMDMDGGASIEGETYRASSPVDVDVGHETDQRPRVPLAGPQSDATTRRYPNAGADCGAGKSFFRVLEERDPPGYTQARDANPYWPFANKREWEIALWMIKSGLSNKQITEHLELSQVRRKCD